MELRGIRFDVDEYARIRRLRPAIKADLIDKLNSTWPVFFGETFKKTAFLGWCGSVGIDWPVKINRVTGKADYPSAVDHDTLKDMEGRHPFIGEVRQLLKTFEQFKSRALTVDPNLRRHFFGTSVFRSVTGRNQPKNFVFNGPKWLRHLIVPESPDHVLVYVDYVAQEVGIAAALSRDPAMRSVYMADDCHMAFAIRSGRSLRGRQKQTHPIESASSTRP